VSEEHWGEEEREVNIGVVRLNCWVSGKEAE